MVSNLYLYSGAHNEKSLSEECMILGSHREGRLSQPENHPVPDVYRVQKAREGAKVGSGSGRGRAIPSPLLPEGSTFCLQLSPLPK